jgi:hypothetical protein
VDAHISRNREGEAIAVAGWPLRREFGSWEERKGLREPQCRDGLSSQILERGVAGQVAVTVTDQR